MVCPGKKIIIFCAVVVFLLTIMAAFVYFLIFTSVGAEWTLKNVLMRYLPAGTYSIRTIEGNFFHQLTFRDVEIKDFLARQAGYVVRIQKVDIYWASLGWEGLNIEAHNGRFFLPNSGPVVFNGIYQERYLDLDIFSRQIFVEDICALVPGLKEGDKIKGAIGDFNATVKGDMENLKIKGVFRFEELTGSNFKLTDCPADFDMNLKFARQEWRIDGGVNLRKGAVVFLNTPISLLAGKIRFAGDLLSPSIDFYGFSDIGDTKISISVKGCIQKPLLRLSSQPSFSEDKLLIMLLTGHAWKGTEHALEQGMISPDLLKDFLDYFVLGGAGEKWAQQFGITDVSFKYDKNVKGVGVTKEVADKVEVSYAIEQSQVSQVSAPVSIQRVGAGYKITDKLSLEGAKEFKPEGVAGNETCAIAPNDEIFLKYRGKF